MKLFVFAGLTVEKKLFSKLLPIVDLKEVENIYLFRREPLEKELDKVIAISPPQYIRSLKILSEFYRFVQAISICFKQKPDFIIGIYYFPHIFSAAIISMMLKIPLISVFVEQPKLYEKSPIFKLIVRASKKIVVRGKRSKDFIHSLGYQREKIYTPQNIFSFDIPVDAQPKLYDLILIGGYDRDKRIDIFIETVNLLRKKNENIKAAILGWGKLENQIKELIHKYSLENHITLLGFQKDVYKFIQQSKILVITSETEGLPMVMIEVMACGVPCVVPDVGDVTDIAKDGYNALVVRPKDIEAFTLACERLLNDTNLYKTLSAQALKIKEEKRAEYSLEHISSIWNEILK